VYANVRKRSFSEAVQYLLDLGHETLTIKLGLRNTELLLQALDNPQHAFAAVQIAGTNGKGSTAAMLESICRAAGIRTGLYTSPHLSSITERIKINGVDISEADFAHYTERVRSASQELVQSNELQALPTFFEQVTAIALHAFREQSIELAILETGLGGRLDSTTAAGASVVGITAIDMDHEEYLGNTIELIAAEKAATIRPNVKVVIGRQRSDVLPVLLARCEEVGVLPVLDTFVRSFHEGNRVTLKTPMKTYANLRLGLSGPHQQENAAIAILLAEQLQPQFDIPRSAIVQGLETVRHPGRLELFELGPDILLDGAHNPAGARSLSNYFEMTSGSTSSSVTMIFGAMQEKPLNKLAEILFPWADRLIVTKVKSPRTADLESLVPLAHSFTRGTVHTAQTAREALELALKLTPPDGLICITGSLYLIGELRPRILELVAIKKD
jgi:dihydrofolate synthase/folylpolyglutamate synthase